MPAIDVAMAQSLRRDVLDMLAASIRTALKRRDITEQVNEVKTSFSGWDNCMKATYCKWPAVAIIIIGGLILVSVVWCIIRRICCGLSCCCSFFRCLKCCGDCCGCCDPPGGRKHKYLEAPYVPPDQGYKSHAAMDPHGIPGMHRTVGAATATAHAPPQYAEFDVSRKGSAKDEDALPQMPGWETASKKKVEIEDEAVELDQLKKPEATGRDVSLMTGASSVGGPASPGPRITPVGHPPYGAAGVRAATSGYFAGASADLHAQNSPGFNQHPPSMYGQSMHGYSQLSTTHGQEAHSYNQGTAPYGRSTASPAPESGYGSPAVGSVQGRQTPHAYNGWGRHDSGFTSPAHGASFDPYGSQRQESFDSYRQPGRPSYGMDPPRSPRPDVVEGGGSPSPTQSYSAQIADAGYRSARGSPALPRVRVPNSGYGSARNSPAPQGEYGGYRRPHPAASPYPPDPNRPLQQNSQHPYTESPIGSPTSLQNTAGFDFKGYSRPGTNSSQPLPGPAAPPHLPRQQAAAQPAALQGYRAYQQGVPQGGWSGV